jgi:hypothetical protein
MPFVGQTPSLESRAVEIDVAQGGAAVWNATSPPRAEPYNWSIRACFVLAAWIGLGQVARADPAGPGGPDLDRDGIRDADDRDTDGDGVADVDDNCDRHRNAEQGDRDGDRLGDACDGDAVSAAPGRRRVAAAPRRVRPERDRRTLADAEATLGVGARTGVDEDTGDDAWFTSKRVSLGFGLLHRIGVGGGREIGGHVVVAGAFDKHDHGGLEMGVDALVRHPAGANAGFDVRAALLVVPDGDQASAPKWIARLGPGIQLGESVLDLQVEFLGKRPGGIGFGAFGSIGLRGKGALIVTGLVALVGVLFAVAPSGYSSEQ